MDTTPLLKTATRTLLSANSETLKRKIEILDVLNEIYAEADEETEGEETPEEKDRPPVGRDTNGRDCKADSPDP